MADNTAIIIIIGIGIISIMGPMLHWRLSGKPISDETKLLRRIYALEQQVDSLTAQLADMEKLRLEVESLRGENRRLLMTLSDYMQQGGFARESGRAISIGDIKTEIERLTQELENRRKWRDMINERIVTTPSSANPGFLMDALRNEDKAIDELQDRLDMLRMARGAD